MSFEKIKNILKRGEYNYMKINRFYNCFTWFDLNNCNNFDDLNFWVYQNYSTNYKELLENIPKGKFTNRDEKMFKKLDNGFHINEKTGKITF